MRKPWWEGREPKFSTVVPKGYAIDYVEWERKDNAWRKYLIEGQPLNLSVSDISGAIDDGKASGMAFKAAELTLVGACTLLKEDGFTAPTDAAAWDAALKANGLHYRDVWGNKADLGTATHDALEKLCEGEIPSLSNYEPVVQPYIKAICGWYADNDPEVVATEFLVGSREWLYAGRFDLLYTQNGERVLADLKTSKRIYPGYLIQLAGYSLALEECGYEPVDRMEVIWAQPDGSYSVIESKATHEDFLNLLKAYTSFNRNKESLAA